jgi:hypothetical protein
MTNDKKLQVEESSTEENNTTSQKATITDTTSVSTEVDKKDEEDTGWVAVGSGLGIDE